MFVRVRSCEGEFVSATINNKVTFWSWFWMSKLNCLSTGILLLLHVVRVLFFFFLGGVLLLAEFQSNFLELAPESCCSRCLSHGYWVWLTNCSSSLHWLSWFVGCCSWLSSKCQKCLLLLLLVVCFGYLDNLTTC